MRTAGIICEYNPFHRGHQLQIEKTRQQFGPDTAIVCLMSGNYVQRGEPAIFPKHLRAKAAVLGGADLVLELPLTAAVNGAGYFAEKAVQCLNALEIVDIISFGSECGDISALQRTAALLCTDEFEKHMGMLLKKGSSYAAARTEALKLLGGDPTLLQSPNNALGIDYLRAIRKLGSGMKPWTLKREDSLPSAGDIRAEMREGDRNILFDEVYEGQPLHTLENGERAFLAVLRTLPDRAFETMAFEAEGIYSKVMKACRRENSLDAILMACKSKRFALSRLRRTLLCLFLGLGQREMELEIPYLRVLAFNERGREVLSRARKESAIPLCSGSVPNTPEAKAYFALESRATDLYGLFAPAECPLAWGEEKKAIPVNIIWTEEES